MSNYGQYKKWWIEHQSQHEYPSYENGDSPESAFRMHIYHMSLYELMETLENWGEEVPVQQEPSVTEMWNDMIDKVSNQPYQPMEQTPSFPRPYIKYPTRAYIKYPTEDDPKPKCQKCGISLSGVMGYVCSDSKCPTFMRGTN